MKHLETFRIFNGEQQIWQHASTVLNCQMKFAIYLPDTVNTERLPVLSWLSGLTCTEQNFITKSGFARYADEQNVIVVAPDTSPRGDTVADDEAYDLGQGAGFYVNATQGRWAEHYHMYDYIVKELPDLINAHFTMPVFQHFHPLLPQVRYRGDKRHLVRIWAMIRQIGKRMTAWHFWHIIAPRYRF